MCDDLCLMEITMDVQIPAHDEIARRAFELYDFRREHGLPGDSGSDWQDAERGMTTVHFNSAHKELLRNDDPNRAGVWRVLKAAAGPRRGSRRMSAG